MPIGGNLRIFKKVFFILKGKNFNANLAELGQSRKNIPKKIQVFSRKWGENIQIFFMNPSLS